jgi:hypothetical protein
MAIILSDPLAQTFLVDGISFPNGVFLSSINLFFNTKPGTNLSLPISISIVPTETGYPTGKILDYSYVSLTPDKINVSSQPYYLDSTTYTNFKFSAPVKINPDELYAIIVKSNSPDYNIWTAVQGQDAIRSTLKTSLTAALPSQLTKITSLPKIGSLFKSQNSITWTAIQNEALMFQINRCIFNTAATPTIQFTVPKGLPTAKGTIPSSLLAKANVIYDTLNISTTAISPGPTAISYEYRTTLSSGSSDDPKRILPGNFGSPMETSIYLNDNKGYRVLDYQSNTSFSLNATMISYDNAVSPLISDDGLALYTTRNRINNLELSNNSFVIISGGTGYSISGSANGSFTSPNIAISAPTSTWGTQAYATANVVNGVIDKIYITTPGSGYVETPNVTILQPNTTPAIITLSGETSTSGGNANCRYITKTVTLASGLDSEDLRVYFTAYRPPNSDVNVYYKILSRQDTEQISSQRWQLMTLISNSDTLYSQNFGDIYEYVAAPGTNNIPSGLISYTNTAGVSYNNFYQFIIKIVLSTSDSTFAPYLTDIRAIALPSGV